MEESDDILGEWFKLKAEEKRIKERLKKLQPAITQNFTQGTHGSWRLKFQSRDDRKLDRTLVTALAIKTGKVPEEFFESLILMDKVPELIELKIIVQADLQKCLVGPISSWPVVKPDQSGPEE